MKDDPPEGDEANRWRLIIAGYERTPHVVHFDVTELPFGTKLEMLVEGPDGNEWVKVLPPGHIPEGTYIRKRLDPHAENRAARREKRRLLKATGKAKAAIRKAQEAANG